MFVFINNNIICNAQIKNYALNIKFVVFLYK